MTEILHRIAQEIADLKQIVLGTRLDREEVANLPRALETGANLVQPGVVDRG